MLVETPSMMAAWSAPLVVANLGGGLQQTAERRGVQRWNEKAGLRYGMQ
jgi:hypothetical protein